jgi:hypothetical protein
MAWAGVLLGVLSVAMVPVSAGAATPGRQFAGVHAAGTGNCSSVANACMLTKALHNVAPGGTVELVTPGHEGTASTYYSPGSSGFSIATSGTSATSPVVIEPAPGVKTPILDGGSKHAVLKVGGGMHLRISGLVIQNGNSTASSVGGGISNNSRANLTVANSTFSDNLGSQDGGAIENGAGSTLAVAHSTFSGNAACLGGAIASGYGGSGTTTVTGSTFSGNSAFCQGGAIANGNGGTGSLTISASTFSGNSAPDGAAIENGDGGASMTTITGSTFSANRASTDLSTIDNGDTGGKGSVMVVAADIVVGTCRQASGTWTDLGENVTSSSSCFKGGKGDVSSSALASLLGPLAANGGSTKTMAPLHGNPAIGLIANPSGALCPLAADQTGKPSPKGAPCNAGALQPHPAIASVTISGPDDTPVVTVTGSGFGTAANLGPPQIPCTTAQTGKDFEGLFTFEDTTDKWTAGDDAAPACDFVGLVIDSYTSTTVVFGFGSGYPTYGQIQKGDAYKVELLGVTFSSVR